MDKEIVKRYVFIGLLGGFIGTVMMDVVMLIELVLVKLPLNAQYSILGSAVGGNAWVGLIAHYIVGPGIGFLFGAFISVFKVFHIHSNRKGILLGVLAGIITIPLGCVPTAILSKVPVLKFIGFSALPHLVWGFVLGWVTAIGVKNPRS